jgi:hypothetical protein
LKKILIVFCIATICTLFVPHDALAKDFSIKLSESLDMETNDKKPKDADTKTDKKDSKVKPVKTKEVKKSAKEAKEAKKKPVKETKKAAKKTTTIKKTKHDTVKNSISNVR